jgi:hypothetical protein
MTAPLVALNFTPEEATRYQDALTEARMVLAFAEDAFALLSRIHMDRDHDGHHGLAALTYLCQRGLEACNGREGLHLEYLTSRLMDARALPGKGGAA